MLAYKLQGMHVRRKGATYTANITVIPPESSGWFLSTPSGRDHRRCHLMHATHRIYTSVLEETDFLFTPAPTYQKVKSRSPSPSERTSAKNPTTRGGAHRGLQLGRHVVTSCPSVRFSVSIVLVANQKFRAAPLVHQLHLARWVFGLWSPTART